MLNTAFPKELRIAGTTQDSIVDGPGIRYVIFTQGCPHHCPGCHNPQTHDFAGGHIADVEQILESIRQNPLLSGVTFSGGEPILSGGGTGSCCRGGQSHAQASDDLYWLLV